MLVLLMSLGVCHAQQAPPKVTLVWSVAPDVLSLKGQSGEVVWGTQRPYEAQPGDRIDNPEHQRLVIREGKCIGALAGRCGMSVSLVRRRFTGETPVLQRGKAPMSVKVRYEEMLPDELREVVRTAPVAYVPLGSLEWHGYHLPLGNDAIKVHEICMCAAQVTGGVVLPALFCGVGGGHKQYFGSIMVEEAWIEPLLKRQFDCLAQHGFRVIVAVTGHYPGEQVQMVRRAAEAHMAELGSAKVIALPEYEAFPSDPRRGDHAAKWETSILWHLRPELVEMDRLTDGREDSLYGIYGDDPREHASQQLGEQTVNGIVEGLVRMVRQMLEAG